MAAFAVSAFSAPAAPAAALFNAEKQPVTITGGQAIGHVFTFDPGTTTCNTIKFHGEANAVTTVEQTIVPVYENCHINTIFGNISVTINLNGCDYRFDANRRLHIICPAGKSIVISGPGCTISIGGEQTFENGVSYTNQGTGATRDILVHFVPSGINYSYSGFTCGSGSNTKNGVYSGATTLSGSEPGDATKHIGIWHTP